MKQSKWYGEISILKTKKTFPEKQRKKKKQKNEKIKTNKTKSLMNPLLF